MAKRTVPRPVFDYVDGAANDEVTARRNRSGFQDVTLRPRSLVDVSAIDLRRPCWARSRAADHRRADRASRASAPRWRGRDRARRACGGHDLPAVDDVLALDRGGRRGVARADVVPALRHDRPRLVASCWRAHGGRLRGARADRRRAGLRRARARRAQRLRRCRRGSRWRSRQGVTPPALVGGLRRAAADLTRQRRPVEAAAPPTPLRRTSTASSTRASPGTTSRCCASTGQGPLVIKGMMRADDAMRAVEHGADAIIVSNHGGRQLDHAQATIEALPAIAEAVDGRRRSTWTAASGAAPTSSRRSRSARGRCLSGGRWSTGSAPRASRGPQGVRTPARRARAPRSRSRATRACRS